MGGSRVNINIQNSGIGHERLKEMRRRHKYTQKHLGYMLNVAQSTYSDYENGTLSIHSELWFALAIIYNVSVDYMMGLTDDPRRLWGQDGFHVTENASNLIK